MTSQTWRVRACAAERPTNPDPLTMHPGDRVEITGQEEDGWVWCRNWAGKEDWVPLSYLTGAGEGTTRTALADMIPRCCPSKWEKSSRPCWKSMGGCGVRMRRENGDGYA
jgi:hypothetical protein